VIVAPRARLVPATRARRPRLAVRLVARITRLAAIFVVRPGSLTVPRAPVVARFTARRRRVGFRVGNRFGGLG